MITVFTPTYNRANTLIRVYQSLILQTYKDFEWIIIDDGSTDNTNKVVSDFIKENLISIVYVYQENNGKHIAFNKAVDLAKGDFFAVVDSDDEFKPDSFEIMLKYWEMIPESDREKFKGVTCRCYNPISKETIGPVYKKDILDASELDAKFKYKFIYDMWGITRTDVLKEFKYPAILGGQKEGLRYYPETILWNNISRKYKTRYINDALCGYYKDQNNALTGKTVRAKENRYLWLHYINDVFDYFWYRPMLFVKAFVGLSRDSFILGGKNEAKRASKLINKKIKRILYYFFYFAGLYLAKRYIYDKNKK